MQNWISISNNIGILCYFALCFSFIDFWVTCITWKQKFQIFVILALCKNQGCYTLPPLKEISSRDLGRLERKIGLGNCFSQVGWATILKRNFCVKSKISCPIGCWVYYLHVLECGFTRDGLSRIFLRCRVEIGRASCRERV